MKNKILLILVIFIVILCVATYLVYNYRVNIAESQAINNEYKAYYNKQIIGTDLASVINKTMDNNEKYNIPKDDSGYFIENDTNSIKMEIYMTDNEQTYRAETFYNNGIEQFMEFYRDIKFKCSKIEYHEKTNKIKYLYFEQIPIS